MCQQKYFVHKLYIASPKNYTVYPGSYTVWHKNTKKIYSYSDHPWSMMTVNIKEVSLIPSSQLRLGLGSDQRAGGEEGEDAAQ